MRIRKQSPARTAKPLCFRAVLRQLIRPSLLLALPVWACVVLVLTVTVGVTYGSWQIVTASSAVNASRALAMPTGATPTVAVNGLAVSVSYTAAVIGATPISNYTVRRYSSPGGIVQAIGAACSGVVAALSCIEAGVPAGAWTYSDQPLLQGSSWAGIESTRSTVVHVVAAPTNAHVSNGGGVGATYINAANYTSISVSVTLPASSLATDRVFVTLADGGGHSVTNAVGVAAPNGAGTITVTGLNTTALNDGTLTLTAWSQAATGEHSPTFTGLAPVKDIVKPTGTNIQCANHAGGTAGRPESGDVCTFSFSEQVNPASVLAAWNGSAVAVDFPFNNFGGAGLDRFQVLSGATLLPFTAAGVYVTTNGNYIGGSRDYGTSTMLQTGATISITLGGNAQGTNTVGTANRLGWTVPATISDLAGNVITAGTITGTSATQF